MLSPLYFTASRTLVRKIGGERLERNNVFGHPLLPNLQSAWLKQLYTVKPRVPLLSRAWRVACRRGLNCDSSKWPEKSGLFVLLLSRLQLRVADIPSLEQNRIRHVQDVYLAIGQLARLLSDRLLRSYSREYLSGFPACTRGNRSSRHVFTRPFSP